MSLLRKVGQWFDSSPSTHVSTNNNNGKWVNGSNLLVYREGTPGHVLQQYYNPNYPESILIGGVIIDWPSHDQYKAAVMQMRNKTASVDRTPVCVNCHRPNPEGVMILLPLFRNEHQGRPLIAPVTDEMRRKARAIGEDFSGLDFLTTSHAAPQIASWGFFCEASCIMRFSRSHPELIIPVWHRQS